MLVNESYPCSAVTCVDGCVCLEEKRVECGVLYAGQSSCSRADCCYGGKPHQAVRQRAQDTFGRIIATVHQGKTLLFLNLIVF